MFWSELIGGLAAILTTGSFIPQAVKVIRSRDTGSISLWMYLLFTCGIACWLAYGLMIQAMPVILANAVTLVLSLIILSFKLRYK